MSKQPRGIRNHNPGNIEWGDPWQGLANTTGSFRDPRFAQFKAPAWGIRALVRTLITYSDTHGINTVRGAINRWAPPNENDTNAYVNTVAKTVGVGPDQRINFHDYRYMRPMVEAIIRHENGKGPLNTTNSWYNNDVVVEGLRLAGVVAKKDSVLATPEGAATGTAVAAGGAALAIEIAGAVSPAVQQVKVVSDATAGLPDWLRTTLVVLTVIAVGAATYALIRQRRAHKAVQ